MIQLQRKPFEFLSSESIRKIHEASLEILKNTGLKVFSNKAIEIFGDNGLRVDIKENGTFPIRVDRGRHVEERCRSARKIP